MTELLSQTVRDEIDLWLKKFPADQKRSALLRALMVTQEENGGWLTTELMDAVADYLGISKISVYEVATFYSMYHLEPVGKHKISVCMNISCALCGSRKIMDHLEKRLGVKAGGTSKDGLYTLKPVECMAACRNAPMMQIDDREYYENLTPEKVDQILDGLEAKGGKA